MSEPKTIECGVFARQIYHFEADEVPEDERRALQDHLDGCDSCARRLSLERSLLRTLKARLLSAAAPVELKQRVRATLDREARRTSGAGWLEGPRLSALAASILLGAVLLGPTLKDAFQAGAAAPAPRSVRQRVTVVDVDCDRVGLSLAEQRRCRHPHHVNALKLAEGEYWNLSLANTDARMLALSPHMRGHRLEIQGPLYALGGQKTVELSRYDDLGYP